MAGGGGGGMILAANSSQFLWYLTRGLGVASLLLLTASVGLGVLATVGWRSAAWPRFATTGLHRNLTLLAICTVALHVVTTVLDGYAPIALQDAVIPFLSPYRPIWLGLGAVAFDLLIALVVTSLLRARIGYHRWRFVHWLAYAAWPIALVHSLGTGSDARIGWMQTVGAACIAVVALAALGRFTVAGGVPVAARLAAGAAALVAPVGILVWYESGPAQHGWAKQAGTPTSLIAGRRVATHAAVPPTQPTSASLPHAAFSASVVGTIHETNTAAGLVHVVIRTRLRGGAGGSARIDLRGQALQNGVSMTASGVSYVPAGTGATYIGTVTALSGQQVVARLVTGSGAHLQLAFVLNIDTTTGSVNGTVAGTPGAA
jgi:DMSO/TMAO reductase YedYZ heme-binding membrane subunit